MATNTPELAEKYKKPMSSSKSRSIISASQTESKIESINNKEEAVTAGIVVPTGQSSKMNCFPPAPNWIRETVAEFIGTFLLVFIGQCAIACFHLKPDTPFDLFAVAIAFGVGAMIGVTAVNPISGSHLNPAVTVAFACIGRIPFRKIPHYFLGQYMGGLVASCATFMVYHEAINTYDNRNDHLKRPDQWGSMAVFTTFPAPWMTPVGAIVDQTLATAALLFGVVAITHPRSGIPNHHHPFMLAMLICGAVLAFGLNCGAALNPARDLAPRIFLALRGKAAAAFGPLHWLYWALAGVIGPHIGAIIGAIIYDYIVLHPPRAGNADGTRAEAQKSNTKTITTTNTNAINST